MRIIILLLSLMPLCLLASPEAAASLVNTNNSRHCTYTRLIDTDQNQAYESKSQAVAFRLQPVLPLSSSLPRFASVHFIISDNRDDMTFELGALCAQNGFPIAASSCGEGLVGNPCSYSSEYVDRCLTPQEWCRGNGYSLTPDSCIKPEYPADACPKDETLFKSCREDRDRACGDDGYFLNCENGKVIDENGASCPYDNNYKPCICDPCQGYEFTAEEATDQGYVPMGPVCNSCGEMKYMRQPADCGSFVECDCGGIGEACWSGSRKLFASCKDCYVPCPSGQLDRNYFWCEEALKCLLPAIN